MWTKALQPFTSVHALRHATMTGMIEKDSQPVTSVMVTPLT